MAEQTTSTVDAGSDVRERHQDPVSAALRDLPWTASTPDQVGAFYDENDAVLEQIQGGVMHYGYWTSPEDTSDFETAALRLTDLMIDRLGVGPGDRVLDLGCGTGGPAVRIAQRTGASVVGLSISRNDVELGRRRADAAGLSEDLVGFVHGDATVMPFPDDHFDAVHALESIVHIPDRVGVLRQVARVLRPGGRFALTDFVQHAIPSDDEDIAGLLASMAAWRSSPPVARDAYGRFGPAAGLVVDEDLDITDHTKYTIVHTYAGLDAWVQQHGALPAGLAAIHALGAGVDFAAFTEAPQEDGVILVSGHRPLDS